jgi:Flp pilus assembly pilin Flp
VKTIEAEHIESSARRARLCTPSQGRGQTVVMLTLLIPILLGAVALGADVAVFYYNWAQLQRGADAAALAGGSYLPRDTTSATSTAIKYAGLNGIPSGQVTSVAFGNSNTTITVKVQRTVPLIAAISNGTTPAARQIVAGQAQSKQRDTEVTQMDVITRLWVKAFERERAQTMTEYVLIIAAVALVALVAYKALGTAITNEISNVTTNLTG